MSSLASVDDGTACYSNSNSHQAAVSTDKTLPFGEKLDIQAAILAGQSRFSSLSTQTVAMATPSPAPAVVVSPPTC
jgi:hypothetical protein